MLTSLSAPIVMRSVTATSLATYGAGGTKKSAELAVVPDGVAMAIRPDVPPIGTLATTWVDEADVGAP